MKRSESTHQSHKQAWSSSKRNTWNIILDYKLHIQIYAWLVYITLMMSWEKRMTCGSVGAVCKYQPCNLAILCIFFLNPHAYSEPLMQEYPNSKEYFWKKKKLVVTRLVIVSRNNVLRCDGLEADDVSGAAIDFYCKISALADRCRSSAKKRTRRTRSIGVLPLGWWYEERDIKLCDSNTLLYFAIYNWLSHF